MGRRFKLISTGDGWKQIVRLPNPSSTAPARLHGKPPGKYRSINANHVPNGNKRYQHSSYRTKISDQSLPNNHPNVSLHQSRTDSRLASLLLLPPASHQTKLTHIKSPILTLLQTDNTLTATHNLRPAMTKKKQLHPQATKNIHSLDTMSTPGRTLTPSNTPPTNIHLIQNPFRYPQPIWKSYLDTNPWTFATPSATNDTHDHPTHQPEPLPLPPEATHPRWRGRCYKCLTLGHDQNECTKPDRVCARCWQTGHAARNCTYTPSSRVPPFDPLMPRGNMGDDGMPNNRPRMAMVFVPETNKMQHDACEMLRAIVIDARLREQHNLHILQSILMATCATPYPFPITKTTDTQYLLVLPPGIDRDTFLTAHAASLRETGYVAFPWSAAVNGTPLQLRYKV